MTATATYTAQQITAIGGRDWKGRRVYLNEVAELLGIEVAYYGSGNIRHASLDGQTISNTEAARLLGTKVYLDTTTGHLVVSTTGTTRALTDEQVRERIEAAVAARVAAL